MRHEKVFQELGSEVPRMATLAVSRAEEVLREIHSELRFCDYKVQMAASGYYGTREVWVQGRAGIPDELWQFDALSSFNFTIHLQVLPTKLAKQPAPLSYLGAKLNNGLQDRGIAEAHDFLRSPINRWIAANPIALCNTKTVAQV